MASESAIPKDISKTILFVCTSNVCRSPMAEYIGKVHALEKGYTNLRIYSRGLIDDYSHWGSSVNTNATDVCNELYEMNMSEHKSTLLLDEDLKQCDVIYVVTSTHKKWIKPCVSNECYRANQHKLRTIGKDIPDPWFYGKSAYVDCAHMIKTAVGASIDDFLEGKSENKERNTQYKLSRWILDPSKQASRCPNWYANLSNTEKAVIYDIIDDATERSSEMEDLIVEKCSVNRLKANLLLDWWFHQ